MLLDIYEDDRDPSVNWRLRIDKYPSAAIVGYEPSTGANLPAHSKIVASEIARSLIRSLLSTTTEGDPEDDGSVAVPLTVWMTWKCDVEATSTVRFEAYRSELRTRAQRALALYAVAGAASSVWLR